MNLHREHVSHARPVQIGSRKGVRRALLMGCNFRSLLVVVPHVASFGAASTK